MCGITGFWEIPNNRSKSELNGTARKMADAIAHRGPDDSGVWSDHGWNCTGSSASFYY